MNETDDELRARLNAETGKIGWPELERHFARGVLITVAGDLDLIEAALCMIRDDRDRLEAWMKTGRVGRTTAAEARAWAERGAVFWAVVTAPWVLVQETHDSPPTAAH